jgi:hypothetical protein
VNSDCCGFGLMWVQITKAPLYVQVTIPLESYLFDNLKDFAKKLITFGFLATVTDPSTKFSQQWL